MPRVLLAGQQGGAAWPRAHQMDKQLGRRAAACPPRALRVHTLHTVCTPCAVPGCRAFAFWSACVAARAAGEPADECVLQAIGYQEIEEHLMVEQRVASNGPMKLTRVAMGDEGRPAAAAGFACSL